MTQTGVECGDRFSIRETSVSHEDHEVQGTHAPLGSRCTHFSRDSDGRSATTKRIVESVLSPQEFDFDVQWEHV
jgi:hypothetical protein